MIYVCRKINSGCLCNVIEIEFEFKVTARGVRVTTYDVRG
jgi:hypothetical protein